MKRMNLGREKEMEAEGFYGALSVEAGQIPAAAASLEETLQLLYEVPISYLVPDPSFLPPESIRFFYVDENFVKAVLNGATSVGRNTETDRIVDRAILEASVDGSGQNARQVRRRKVHENHLGRLVEAGQNSTGIRTGFLLRSSLVHRRKGIIVCGYQGQQQLAALRLETVAPDIMIGIFDGEMTRLTIAEPSCGLRFGCTARDGKKRLLSLKEAGVPVRDGWYDVKANEKGRIDVLAAVDQMNRVLKEKGETKEDISSRIFAYQFLLAAQKAEFLKKQEA